MQYTENHSLPQWEAADPIQRGDFNTAMESIDAALGAQAAGIAAVAEAYTPDNKPYVIGSYKGNGGSKTIELGFKPSWLWIMGTVGADSVSTYEGYLHKHCVVSTPNRCSDGVTFTDTGFQVTNLDYTYFPEMNENTYQYIYIAFR